MGPVDKISLSISHIYVMNSHSIYYHLQGRRVPSVFDRRMME